jgi:hypothetical protein
MKHFTDMADFGREIMAHAKDMKGTGKKDISGFTPPAPTCGPRGNA